MLHYIEKYIIINHEITKRFVAYFYNTFTFYTWEKPNDIKQLLYRNIPIKINGEDLTAKVEVVSPFLMGYRIMFSLGIYPVKEYIYRLHNFYKEEKKYEIRNRD